jgi:glutamate/tyrosine decarboxylase-like PLP-dependent enzyme
MIREILFNNNVIACLYFRGKMRTVDLDREIQKTLSSGGVPLMVNATCGTTVLGAYDPVDKIADICQKYDVWLHVDVSLYKL